MRFNIIVAHTFNNNGIGIKNKLPWTLKEDLIYFKKITTNTTKDDSIQYLNSVIMGSNTWNSIPECNKPLKERFNIIITRTPKQSNNKYITYITWENLLSSIIKFNNNKYQINNKILKIENNFIIGGESIYKQALQNLLVMILVETWRPTK